MRRLLLTSTSILVVLTLLLTNVPQKASASDISAYELIAWANNLRSAYGLSALTENSIIDASAQWTAETMAASGVCQHLASQGYPGVRDRLMSSWGYGGGKTIWATENMACGTSLTIDAISGYWADADHMRPAVDANYQEVGAGVAVGSNGWTYVVLQAAWVEGGGSGGSAVSNNTPVATTDATSDGVSQWMSPVVTSTPNYDGYIYHVVKSGQTLFYIALAYGVTVDYIKEQNGLSSNDIYEGQTLKIMQAPTPTPTSTFTPTPVFPTRTPTLKSTPATPTPELTATPTPKPSLAAELPKFDRQFLGLLLVILSGLGLLVVVLLNFIKPKPKAPVAAPPAARQEAQPEAEPPKKKPRAKKTEPKP
jgi:LysM repeat protein